MKVLKHLLAGGVESWIAFVAIINIVSFFLYPERNPIHLLVAPVDTLWAISYALAGVLILVGIGKERANIEAAGLMLLISGALIQVLVFAAVGSVRSLAGTWFTILNLLLLAVFASGRVWQILKTSRFIVADIRRGERQDKRERDDRR